MNTKVSMMLVVGVLLAFNSGAQAVTIDLVTVGNAGNVDDTHGDGYGGVDYVYQISKYEVTAGQYTEFLNAVADTDTYGLYNTDMWSISHGCMIQRDGSSGSYIYSVAADYANRPVNYVSWGDSVRFANWLYNGQPTGAQNLATTEDGSYYLNGAMTTAELLAVSREPDATWVIPSEDEWYKAAYHKNDGVTGNYFDYPTSSDSIPSNDLIDPDPGNNATFYDSEYTIGSPYYRTEVGAHENSGSPYGTFDMGGNVFEWNDTLIGSFRGLRGGSYSYNSINYLASSARSYMHDPGFEHYVVGFRVASIPEPAEPNIAVSPLSHDFGDVELGTSSTVIVTISNVGSGDLTVSGIALETDFAITSVPPASVVIEPNETIDVEITYTPTVLGYNLAVLKITNDDPDEPVVEVQLSAVGIEIPLPPSEQIANILAFFDTSVSDGTLAGDGQGNSAGKRLNALRNMIEAAGDLIENELFEEACQQLLDVCRRMDDQPSPLDFVQGEAVPELAAMVRELMTSLGCE